MDLFSDFLEDKWINKECPPEDTKTLGKSPMTQRYYFL